MSIRYAILGLIAEQPSHGYALKQVFDQRVSPLWGLTTGQIYQSLNGLERSGLLTSTRQQTARRPERKVYEITEAGQRALDRWLQSESSSLILPFRDETVIRFMLLRRKDTESLRRSLHRLEEHVARSLDEARATRPARSSLSQVFLEGLVEHLEADLKHLRRLRAEVESSTRSSGFVAGGVLDVIGSSRHALPPPTF